MIEIYIFFGHLDSFEISSRTPVIQVMELLTPVLLKDEQKLPFNLHR